MKITVTEYLHNNNDSFSDWEIAQSDAGNYDLSGKAAEALHYRLDEVKITLEIDLDTGAYTILKVEDGQQTLTND